MTLRTHTSRFRWQGAPPRIVAGLISGTSADGIATAIVRLTEKRGSLSVKQLGFANVPYPEGMQHTILSNSLPGTGSVDLLTRLNAAVGVAFAHAVKVTARRAKVRLERVELIGSHGQTVHHLPEPEHVHGIGVRSTMQVGDPSVIAQETGIPVVGDFRTADMAVGGQGAPLVPFLDYLLFRSEKDCRLLLNLGGIANVTLLPKRCSVDMVRGFDTGPANMIMDALAKRLFGQDFDRNGRIAKGGAVDPALLTWLMSIDYFRKPPPKSTGRELFGAEFIGQMISRAGGAPPEDLLATATEFTALSVYDQYVRFLRPYHSADEVLVSGGGAHNLHLMRRLQHHFGSIPVRSMKPPGFSADAKEAILFAVLAYFTALGRPSNLPHISGASRSVILGKICVP